MTSSTLPLHPPFDPWLVRPGLYTSKLWALGPEPWAMGVDSRGPMENSGGEGATDWCCLCGWWVWWWWWWKGGA